MTIPGKTRCALLHYDSWGHCACPLNKFMQAFKVVNLFLKHSVHFQQCIERDLAGISSWRGNVCEPWKSLLRMHELIPESLRVCRLLNCALSST
jgi:hypothetical protein